jgi:hypothetical protein
MRALCQVLSNIGARFECDRPALGPWPGVPPRLYLRDTDDDPYRTPDWTAAPKALPTDGVMEEVVRR